MARSVPAAGTRAALIRSGRQPSRRDSSESDSDSVYGSPFNPLRSASITASPKSAADSDTGNGMGSSVAERLSTSRKSTGAFHVSGGVDKISTTTPRDRHQSANRPAGPPSASSSVADAQRHALYIDSDSSDEDLASPVKGLRSDDRRQHGATSPLTVPHLYTPPSTASHPAPLRPMLFPLLQS